jgi:hypothetical protein
MAIVSGDITYKLSTKVGAAGNVTAQGDVNQSLGKYISTTLVTPSALNNLFDNISGAENAASTADYRCIFVHNGHASLTLQSAMAWLSAEVPLGANISIGVDAAAASPVGQGPTSQAAVIATETDVPAGVTFSAPTTKLTGVPLGDIGPGQCRAIWIKRQATNSTALNNDGCTLRVEGDTAA